MKNKKKNNICLKILKFIFLLLVLGILIGGITIFLVMSNVIDKRTSIDEENKTISEIITFENDGETVSALSNFDKNSKNYIEYRFIPKNLINAVVSIEDKRFYKHDGIDVIRTMRAIISAVFGGSADFGGSTITQQLVKTSTNDDGRTWTRKVREWVRAVEVDKKLTKNQIITTYLNTIYFGNNNFGIAKVSKDYFDKEVTELNLAECAALAAAIQTPEGTNPFKSEEAKERLLIRKNIVLKEMLDLNKITNDEYKEAKEYKLIFRNE